MKKIVLLLLAFGAFESALALDSDLQTLTTVTGATDYFKINCAADTDHLNFKLLQDSVDETPVETVQPQILNATLTQSKLKLTTKVSEISAGINKEIILNGGNGSYVLMLDTIGTNLTLKNSQIYSVQFQCLNVNGDVTAGTSALAKLGFESSSKKLANNKAVKYAISCKKNKITGDSYGLRVTLFNKTPIAFAIETKGTKDLTAQLLADRSEGSQALNTTGDILNMQSGNGDYFVMVNSPINAAKNYHFQYSCLNTSNIEAKTSAIQILQDQ